jgi:hypothetical protein
MRGQTSASPSRRVAAANGVPQKNRSKSEWGREFMPSVELKSQGCGAEVPERWCRSGPKACVKWVKGLPLGLAWTNCQHGPAAWPMDGK